MVNVDVEKICQKSRSLAPRLQVHLFDIRVDMSHRSKLQAGAGYK